MTQPAATSPVLVSGATGLVGGRLVRALRADGVPVRALSRSPDAAARGSDASLTWHGWDGVHPPAAALRGAGAVVHLSGEPLFGGLPTAARKERIASSRIDSSRALAQAIGALSPQDRPTLLVCASAVGYYGDRGEEPLEEDATPGDGFLARLCVDWEAAAGEARAHGLRVVTPRFGVVLAAEGGALAAMAVPFRLGLGGRLGSGRQWFPWVHVDDVVGLVRAALRDERLEGAVNAVSPEPVRNEELTRTLARVLGRPAFLPVPATALRLALGDLARELLDSRRVVPRAALDAGFAFAQPTLEAALRLELETRSSG